jgi:hypothetical protein
MIACRLSMGKLEGKRSLGRPRRRWVDDFCLAQDKDKRRALVNAAMNLQVPYIAGKLSSDCITGGLPSSAQLHRGSRLSSVNV